MKSYIYLLSFVFFFICSDAISQETNSRTLKPNSLELIERANPYSKVKFVYENKIYKRKELGEVIINDQLAWSFYKKYQKRKRTAKRFGITSLGFFSITFITLKIIPFPIPRNLPPGSSGVEYLVVPYFSAIGGCISGSIAMGVKLFSYGSFN